MDNRGQPSTESLALARQLVLKHGWNSTSYQIINPGIQLWFTQAHDAVVGFVSYHGVRVVVGAPVCAGERLGQVATEFETDAEAANEKVCYLAAEARLESLYAESQKYSKVLLGAQPVWQPKKWAGIIAGHKSLRAQLNRARNKGVTIREWSVEKAADNSELLNCLRQWLELKGLPPLHFMVEPYTLSRLYDRRVFVAEQAGKAVGFVTLSPVKKRNGWLFEQFVHQPKAPNGTTELMIDFAMRSIAEGGYDYATLGLSPLSTRAAAAPFRNPFWLHIVIIWMRVHGRRFYNFEGLDSFKAKLQPERWEPIFAIYNKPRISPKTLYAIAAAFSENEPAKLVLSGLGRAVVSETKQFRRSFLR